ncbi:MAG: hypothetical protein GY856_50775, partial [bacterium]|nr:hypothetical protein [bacterium]
MLPWDVAAPANLQTRQLVDQALDFVVPTAPWDPLVGLPVPFSIAVTNTGSTEQLVRVELALPPGALLMAWDEPISHDPLVWEFALAAGEGQGRVVWLQPAAELSLHYTVSYQVDSEWVEAVANAEEITAEVLSPAAELRRIAAGIAECSAEVDDAEVEAQLQALLAAVTA